MQSDFQFQNNHSAQNLKLSFYLSAFFALAITFVSFELSAGDKKLAKREMKVGEYNRSYYLRYPEYFDSQTRFPLLIVLHGGDRKNGDEAAKRTGFDKLADDGRYIAVFPNGFKGKWHDGRLPKKERKRNKYIKKQDNDIAFLKQLIDYMVQYEQVDPKRVYITGMSNGGMMSIRMACEASDKITAIAPIIANMPVDIVEACKPKKKISFLLMNGTADPLVPWDGGHVNAAFKNRGKVLSTTNTLKFWKRHNGCSKVKSEMTLPNKNTKDGSIIGKKEFVCDEGAEMVLYSVRGGGHTLPGSNVPNRPRLLGKKNLDANGAVLIWDFLKEQSR